MSILQKRLLSSLFILTFILIIYGLTLVSKKVTKLERKLSYINSEISREGDNINTLNAEWSFLSNPNRIEKLALKFLPNLSIVKASDIKNIDAIPEQENLVAIGNNNKDTLIVANVNLLN